MNDFYCLQLARQRREEITQSANARLNYERDESGATPVRVDLGHKLIDLKESLRQMMTPAHSHN